METATLAIEEVFPWEGNPRRGSVEKIKESLQHFGQIRPIVVRHQDRHIIAGNHTYRAAKELGWETIEVVQVQLSDDDAKAYLLADNKTADAAGYDDAALVTILEDLSQRNHLEYTGFSYDDLEDLTAAIEGIKETQPEPFTGGYAEPPEETAERWADRNEGQRREVVFLLMEEDFNKFRALVEDLKKGWALSSMADTIFNAVRVMHEHEFGEDGPQQEQSISIEPIVEGSTALGEEK